MIIEREHILEAYKRIQAYIHNTPVLTSSYINKLSGSEVYFKCENFQKVGAFKIRGATNALLSINPLPKIIATHSSGNHAQAIALAAKTQGIKAHIVMPDNSPTVKVNAVRDYGAEITFCVNTQKSRSETLAKVVKETGATEIHPYDHKDIIIGQATSALELLKDQSDFDYVIAPVGGGGLLSGTALSAHYFSNDCKVIGAEPLNADDAARSFRSGKLIPSINPNTIADGLLTSLGSLNFEIIKDLVSDIKTVSEMQIVDSMRIIWERMKIIVEPSSATALAVLLSNKDIFQNRKVGIILSGGNVDLTKLPWNNE